MGAGKNERRLPSGTRVDGPAVMPEGFTSFAEYEAAWASFERKLSAPGSLRCENIPWPTTLPTVSGVEAQDPTPDKKRKLRAAVLRWHPDKWGPVLARVCEEERAKVVECVKEVTRKILDERRRFGKR